MERNFMVEPHLIVFSCFWALNVDRPGSVFVRTVVDIRGSATKRFREVKKSSKLSFVGTHSICAAEFDAATDVIQINLLNGGSTIIQITYIFILRNTTSLIGVEQCFYSRRLQKQFLIIGVT